MRNFLFLLLILSAFTALAETLTVSNAWVRTIPPRLDRTAAFMELRNTGDQDLILERATSPQFADVELHRTETDPLSGVSRMLGQKQIAIPAKTLLTFKPGDYHIMLITPVTEVKEGDFVDLTLFFANHPPMEVKAPVTRIPASGNMPMSHHHHHH
jgi:copper(I)-binding protein